jgi:hypothetical protein
VAGAIIHFHDIFDNFEYPDEWVFDDNRWRNEQYLLRALLTDSESYEVLLMTDLIYRRYRQAAAGLDPPHL